LQTEQRYLIVSADSHAGPSLERQLRDYCPKEYLPQFDEYAAEVAAVRRAIADNPAVRQRGVGADSDPDSPSLARQAYRATKECPGQQDPHARLRDMDADGVAADVIFAGGQNDENIPFIGFGVDAGPAGQAYELRAVGFDIWNRWLADFVSVAPERHVGVMQVPIWDVDRAVRTVEECRRAGLKGVNFPAPRSDYPAYSDPIYEPFWAACEDLDVPLLSHSGGGEPPLGFPGPAGQAIYWAEVHWLSRRGLWQTILPGIFERHPKLKLVFTEQRAVWVVETLNDLDSIYLTDMHTGLQETLPKKPSEYWFSNCYLSGSFLARFEVMRRHEVGLGNLMWGSDYPHVEGTWPYTKAALRRTFAGLPHDEVRRILGTNALSVFDLDAAALQDVADRIGPVPDELDEPLADDEVPEFKGFAFREVGNFA
jgi:predicted TIM-barrel fold metal-dependent hydrolase